MAVRVRAARAATRRNNSSGACSRSREEPGSRVKGPGVHRRGGSEEEGVLERVKERR